MKKIQEFLWFCAGADKEILSENSFLVDDRLKFSLLGFLNIFSTLIVFLFSFKIFFSIFDLSIWFPMLYAFCFSFLYFGFYRISSLRLNISESKYVILATHIGILSYFFIRIYIGSFIEFTMLGYVVFGILFFTGNTMLFWANTQTQYTGINLIKRYTILKQKHEQDLAFSELLQNIQQDQNKLQIVEEARKETFKEGIKSAFDIIGNGQSTKLSELQGYDKDRKNLSNTWNNVLRDLNTSFEKLKTEIKHEQYQEV